MSQEQSAAFGASRVLLKILRVLNLVMGVALIIMFAASFPFESVFFEFFSKRPARIDPSWLVPTIRIWIVFALPMIAAVHILLSRLLDVVETVRTGDPFVPDNAVRLKTIAWCVLTTQLLQLTYGLFAATVNAAGSNVRWEFSLTGWVAVVLLFVLAQVFQAGTRMRADLETMI